MSPNIGLLLRCAQHCRWIYTADRLIKLYYSSSIRKHTVLVPCQVANKIARIDEVAAKAHAIDFDVVTYIGQPAIQCFINSLLRVPTT